jgi:hypothetical protein
MSVAPPTELFVQLRTCGKDLPDPLRSEILQLGNDAIPPLLELLLDDEANLANGPGDGWGPIHSVALLAELKAEAAVEPMLQILETTSFDVIIHDRILVHLPSIGPAILTPVLKRLNALHPEDELYAGLCALAAQAGVQDPQIFGHLCALFENHQTMGAVCFADYGDKRALPILRNQIERFEPNWRSAIGVMNLTEMADAYQRLAGSLPKELEAHVTNLVADWRRFHALSKAPAVVQASPKVGRNDPCPCGSGKKHKKCCIAI